MYIFGRFILKIVGQALSLWFTVCFFTLKYCYLLLSLFISITIISIIISIITVTIAKYIAITFQFFTTLTNYILAICWFKIWFSFCHVFFFLNSMLSFFVDFSNFALCQFSFHIAFRRIQINEFERHSLPLPFNSDWKAVFGNYIFVLFPPD